MGIFQINAKHIKTSICAIALAVGTFASPASAMLLHDEVVNGDLDAIGSSSFNLTLGLNEINGNWNQTGALSSDNDGFSVILGAGLKIDSIILNYGALGNGEFLNTSLSFNPGNLFDDNFAEVTAQGSSSQSAAFNDTTGPDTGVLDTTLENSIWSFSLIGSVIFSTKNWFIDIQTSENITTPSVGAVPLPAALPLYGTGLAILGFIGWRRKQKKLSA